MIYTSLLSLMQFLAVMLVTLGYVLPFVALLFGKPASVSEQELIRDSAGAIILGTLVLCVMILLDLVQV